MFMRYVLPSALFVGLTLHANAQSVVSPGLGLPSNGSAADAQAPTDAAPCGNVSIPSTIDNSTTVQADTNGDVTVTIQNFVTGVSGSRAVTAQIDSGGAGQSFMPAAVTTNGDEEPTSTGTQTLIIQIPPGTLCTGGKDERRCLLAFKTAGGFGNCVAITQPNGAATGPTNPVGAPLPAASSTNTTAPAIGKREKTATSKRALPRNPALLKRDKYVQK